MLVAGEGEAASVRDRSREIGIGVWVSPLLSDACVAAVEGNEEEKDREERGDCGWASLA